MSGMRRIEHHEFKGKILNVIGWEEIGLWPKWMA